MIILLLSTFLIPSFLYSTEKDISMQDLLQEVHGIKKEVLAIYENAATPPALSTRTESLKVRRKTRLDFSKPYDAAKSNRGIQALAKRCLFSSSATFKEATEELPKSE